MIKAEVTFQDMEGFDAQFKDVIDAVTENLEQVAEHIFTEAKSSLEFKDKTGNLRKSIKLKKSKYIDGGYIVSATGRNADKGYHAWLVEYGHVQLPSGGRVPPHPFLRQAKEKGLRYAIELFRSKKR